jgi:hypothetical protein
MSIRGFYSGLGIAVFLMFALISCADKKYVPISLTDTISSDSLISQEKMIHILADVHMIEAELMLDRNAGQGSNDLTRYYYEGIFKKYQITRTRYDANLKYYSQNPALLGKMYDKVILEIELRQKKSKVTEE